MTDPSRSAHCAAILEHLTERVRADLLGLHPATRWHYALSNQQPDVPDFTDDAMRFIPFQTPIAWCPRTGLEMVVALRGVLGSRLLGVGSSKSDRG